eukprot:3241337-Pleurochrysis_carterae.AAC.3
MHTQVGVHACKDTVCRPSLRLCAPQAPETAARHVDKCEHVRAKPQTVRRSFSGAVTHPRLPKLNDRGVCMRFPSHIGCMLVAEQLTFLSCCPILHLAAPSSADKSLSLRLSRQSAHPRAEICHFCRIPAGVTPMQRAALCTLRTALSTTNAGTEHASPHANLPVATDEAP